MLLQGAVHIRIKVKKKLSSGTIVVDDEQVATLHAGESFGELALMRNEPRSATSVTGNAPTLLLVVKKYDYDASLKGLHLKEAAKRFQFLSLIPIFSNWSYGDLAAVSLQMKKLNLMSNSLILRQGDPATNIYFIVEGRCRVLKRLHVHCYQTSIVSSQSHALLAPPLLAPFFPFLPLPIVRPFTFPPFFPFFLPSTRYAKLGS
jgi:hypothetical protein